MTYRVAVAGTNTLAGREALKALAERDFPVAEITALGTGRSAGQQISFGERQVLKMRALEAFDFAGLDLVIFAVGETEARAHIPRAVAAGAQVVDLSPAFRMEPGVALVVPEVNAEALTRNRKKRIIASPSPTAVFAALVAAPLRALAPLLRVNVVSLQPASGAGKDGMDELFAQTRASFVNDIPAPQHFPKPIAFNLVPQTSAFGEDGATRDEALLPLELRKLLDPDLKAMATCLRVPVFVGEALALQLEFAEAVGIAEARAALRHAPGLSFFDTREEGGYPTPMDVAGEDEVSVSRLRRDGSVAHGLSLFVVGDNLRKGSGLNGVQIAEALAEKGLLARALPVKE
jgi:aspartate-semialdehyde dehydrogenase